MRTTFTVRTLKEEGRRLSKRYWYYVSRSEEIGGSPVTRLPAPALERAVAEAIAARLADRSWFLDRLQESSVLPTTLANWQRITDTSTCLTSGLDLAPLIDGADKSTEASATFDAPYETQQNGRARPIVIRSGDAPRRDPDLIALVADARRWMAELLESDTKTAAGITLREDLRKGAVSRILPLAWLAPDIATAILEGRQPPSLTAKWLRELPELPLCWHEQRALLGFPAD